jgi:hypothetical protein
MSDNFILQIKETPNVGKCPFEMFVCICLEAFMAMKFNKIFLE